MKIKDLNKIHFFTLEFSHTCDDLISVKALTIYADLYNPKAQIATEWTPCYH